LSLPLPYLAIVNVLAFTPTYTGNTPPLSRLGGVNHWGTKD
jgi:hypothetical protein